MDSAEKIIIEDKILISQIIKGDAKKFRPLVQRYQQRIFNCAYGVTRNKEDAADVTQEVFIRFFNNISQFDSDRPLAPYLLKIAVNCSRNELRKRRWHASLTDEEYAIESLEPNPREQLAGKEKARVLRNLINELPIKLREICTLYYLSNCSCNEVAEILNASENAVKVSLYRVRKKLIAVWNKGEGCYE